MHTFAGVFGTAATRGYTLNFEALGLQQMDLQDQDQPFTADEVWAAIKATPSDRAPGPNGFMGAFYKTAWPIIQQEVMEAIHAFEMGNNRGMK
jgi:hypothetical protein